MLGSDQGPFQVQTPTPHATSLTLSWHKNIQRNDSHPGSNRYLKCIKNVYYYSSKVEIEEWFFLQRLWFFSEHSFRKRL